MLKLAPFTVLALAAAGCSPPPSDPRGVARDEVLVQVVATGKAESKPDEARFSVGVSTFGATAAEASNANARKMAAIIAALKTEGVVEADIQTSQISIAKQDWGPNRGKFQAGNTVNVRMRAVDKAAQALGTATAAGANTMSGPDFRTANPEAAGRSAYAAAFMAARARADAYAEAAGLKVARVLRIRDNAQPGVATMDARYDMAPVAVEAAPAPPLMAGTNETGATVSVDFALGPK
ncbi:SIMPL domain-containing protein [Sphingomonas sp.]|jgi:hypothetical protein|uniref:SIMPL domain-containing protein n=1 Tax=Sphingomonas sp. TaxID=28214 RepID=UPI002EDAC4A6